MSNNKITVRRVFGTVFAAAIVSVSVGVAAAPSHAVQAAAMAKCIPGTGNPMNPCPTNWP